MTPSGTPLAGTMDRATRSSRAPAEGGAPTWPAAVSERSVGMLARRPRSATVVAVHPLAFYLRFDRSRPDGTTEGILPVVAQSGLRLPNAVVLAPGSSRLGWGVQPGDRVGVGDGEIRLPGATIRRARVWRPVRVPTSGHLPGVAATGSLGRLASPGWAVPARHLAATALRGESLVDVVGHTVGVGQGLTPSGDDVLCGVLLALRLAGAEDARRHLWTTVRPRLGATTAVSAALLTEAADGYAVPAVVRLAAALAGGRESEPDVVPAALEVRAIGHSSGADLLAGLAGALAAADSTCGGDPSSRVLGLPTVGAHHLPTTPGVTS